MRGFTLIELMVSLLIFGLISAASVSLLSFGVRARGIAVAHFDASATRIRLHTLMEADFSQAADRVVRDRQGAPKHAFSVRPDTGIFLVRRGWRNYDARPRPSMQPVLYRLVEDRVERVTWSYLDGAVANPPSVLMRGVQAMDVRVRAGGIWSRDWTQHDRTELPDAIEITLHLKSGVFLRQLFLVGPGNMAGAAKADAS